MHESDIEQLNEILLGPMVGIGVNEETYAQPQDANAFSVARYMPDKIFRETPASLLKKLNLNDKIQKHAPIYHF